MLLQNNIMQHNTKLPNMDKHNLTLDDWTDDDELQFQRMKRTAFKRRKEQDEQIQIEQMSYNDYITNNV